MDTVSIVRAVARHVCGTAPRECVFSSRVRIARNIRATPFPHRGDEGALRGPLAVAIAAMEGLNKAGGGFELVDLARLPTLEKEALVECHLISRDLLLAERVSALVVSKKSGASILVNEEDHFRIQVLSGGLRLKRALALAKRIERELDQHTTFAKHDGLGFLTACPTNVGTGLRASVMLQLPALFFARRLETCLQRRVGRALAVRGIYGEGSGPLACLLQISNQTTAGMDEAEALAQVTKAAQDISRDEQRARASIQERFAWDVEDLVYRAAATLTAARSINSGEAMDRLSQVRLGIDLGLLDGVDRRIVDQLMIFIRPASLQVLVGEPMAPRERDMRRAKLIREHLQGLIEVP